LADATLDRVGTRLRRFPWAVVSTVAMAAVLVALVATYRPGSDPATEIGSLIRCPVCQGVPIADSPSPMARDMMEVLRQSLADGATRQDAIDTLLGAYPGSLLLEPSVSASTIALWLVPLLALVAGAGLAITVRRGSQSRRPGGERREVEIRLGQVESDLSDLAIQVAGGEIDPEAARHLREAYQAELEEARADLAATTAPEPAPTRSPRRVALGAAFVLGSLVLVVAAAGAFLVDRPASTSGVAGLDGDPADFSNETLAAVIAANADHPQIDGMRMALAERYFEEGDYQAAFPHYLDVASSDLASATQAATALTRLGWMAYDGNGAVDTALDLLAEAQALAPEDPFPLYLEGIVTWCGLDRPDAAADAFRQVLARGVGDDTVRAEVEADLAAAEAGERCSQ
jgi:cytochrome c-type biogenesis protein CcmH